MSDEQDSLSDLIDALADGSLDGSSLLRDLPEGPVRDLLSELRVIAAVADVHRSQIVDDSPEALVAPPAGGVAASSIGQRWGNFQILRKLGEGSFGDVYLAHDLWLDHQVALKVVKPDVPDRTHVLKEARKLVRVRHPNVVTVHGADVHEGHVGFWMDYVDGLTLKSVVDHEGVRSVDEAIAWGKDLCRAVGAVHAGGIIHRDIKAQNVIRQRSDGRLILMDFGAGQFMDPRKEPASPGQGTPLYLAPELLDGGRASERSDVYALGVLLFYLVSKRFPIEASTWSELAEAHARGQRLRLQDVRHDISDGFASVIRRMIAHDPADRFATVGSVREALEELQSTTHKAVERVSLSSVAAAILVGIATVTLIGALCSYMYNSPIDRVGAFDPETALAWPVWGFRALVAAAFEFAAFALAMVIARRIGLVLAMPFARWTRPLGTAVKRGTAAFIGGGSSAMWLLLTQLAVMGLWALVFQDMYRGLDSFISRRPPIDFSALAPENQPRHIAFAFSVVAQVALFGALWPRIARSRWSAANAEMRILVVGGVFLTLATFLVGLVVPFRILYHNKSERVAYGAQRCYLVGVQGNDGRLFCPEQPPWNRAVRLDDPALRREGVVENIFAGLKPQKP